MRRLATRLTVTQSLLILGAVLWAAGMGCDKKENSAPPAQAAPQQQAEQEPVAAPPYKVPDTLPARAELKLVKQENGASIYKANWPSTFTYDPKLAGLALDVNTAGWAYKGKIVITNKEDDESAGSGSHDQGYPTQPPTTQGLDLPAEHLLLGDDEKQWVKAGGVTIFIRNEESATPGPAPTILWVDLVPWESK